MLHTVIEGSPGVGKTELAKLLANVYNKMGILSKNKFKIVKRHDLIGGYLGQTATKTNKILEEDKYTKENTKLIKDGNNIIQEPVSNTGLCIIQEFVLRWFDLTKKNDKRWFLTPEMAIYHKLYKMNK